MSESKKRPDGCLRCGRKLKNPSPTGMGPVCTKKAAAAMATGGSGPVAAGQLAIPQEKGAA